MLNRVIAIAVIFVAAILVRRWFVKTSVRKRLMEAGPADEGRRGRVLFRRVRFYVPFWGPLIFGGGVILVSMLVAGRFTQLGGAFGAIGAIIAFVVWDALIQKKRIAYERHLADLVDLIVGALRAGGGFMEALEGSLTESRGPLTLHIESLQTRIRLGESTHVCLRDFSEEVGLESTELFASAVSVHLESGGGLAEALSTVSHFIRDRVDVQRMIQSQATQARASMIAIAFITYFLAYVMWRSDPPRMEGFLTTKLGGMIAVGVVLLQSFGLLWIYRMSRIRY